MSKLDMGKAAVFADDGTPIDVATSPWARVKQVLALRPVRITLIVVGIVVLFVMPVIVPSQYIMNVIVVCLIWIPLSIGQNLVTGNAGVTVMGQAAFYAVGAYTAAILSTRTEIPHPIIFLIAMCLAGLVGFVISLPAVRVSGDYVFVVTLGLNLIVLDVARQWIDVTGGAAGTPGIPLFTAFGWVSRSVYDFYWVALIVAAVCTALAVAIGASRYGRTLTALREDRMAAEASGIRATAPRVWIIAVSAMMGGLAGALLAFHLGFVGPSSFDTQVSLLIFEMAIIGGLGSVRGSILGAVLLIALPELLRPLQDIRLGLGGIIIILLMIYRPNGILGSSSTSPLVK
ncbi:branched-chain amino acid ABC transporter permease [Agreia sp. PsM10]|uniref:branched-chain amino acid ABC transporter permease n=1 Tax=Agreia sp. PsM10 TaxID=3030533 RepID=UPI00263AFC1B|nr:branched-chain amino acid ABC transporter permease [Agreia sp. PsM10]MDN4641048.1 branched-chain amino acid ABC transporter permease [Agreia sp. PsM10]